MNHESRRDLSSRRTEDRSAENREAGRLRGGCVRHIEAPERLDSVLFVNVASNCGATSDVVTVQPLGALVGGVSRRRTRVRVPSTPPSISQDLRGSGSRRIPGWQTGRSPGTTLFGTRGETPRHSVAPWSALLAPTPRTARPACAQGSVGWNFSTISFDNLRGTIGSKLTPRPRESFRVTLPEGAICSSVQIKRQASTPADGSTVKARVGVAFGYDTWL
jgi:hypothetical protein